MLRQLQRQNHLHVHRQNVNNLRAQYEHQRLRNQNQDAYNVSQHTKAVEMLERINNEKMKRQEKIAKDLKRKQNM